MAHSAINIVIFRKRGEFPSSLEMLVLFGNIAFPFANNTPKLRKILRCRNEGLLIENSKALSRDLITGLTSCFKFRHRSDSGLVTLYILSDEIKAFLSRT